MFDDFPTCLTHSSTDPKITNLPHPPSVIFLEKLSVLQLGAFCCGIPIAIEVPPVFRIVHGGKTSIWNGAGGFFMFEVLQIFCKVSYPLVI